MSAGPFTYSIYTSNSGALFTIEIQPETLALWTALGYTAPDPNGDERLILVSGSRKRRGTSFARTVTIKNPTPPSGYKVNSPITLPIPDADTFSALPGVGQNLGQSYLSNSTWVIVGKREEKI